LAIAGLLAVVGTACSSGDTVGSRADVVAMFEGQDLSTKMSECLADATIEEFGLDTMNEQRGLTEEETTKISELTQDCVNEVGVENVQTDTSVNLDDAADSCANLPTEQAKKDCEDSIAELQDMGDGMPDDTGGG